MDYIPAPPIRQDHQIFLRKDMRYGDDDPSLWPQDYSPDYPHLAAIPRKPVGSLSQKRDIAVMWWDPCAEDFVSDSTSQILTRGLGKLKPEHLAKITGSIDRLREEYDEYHKSVSGKVHDMFPLLFQQLRLGTERLLTLPITFPRMVAAVATVQRLYLEAHALLNYCKRYKPRMDRPSSGPLPVADNCVGAFTTEAAVVQLFRAAGLPYWFLRPTWHFSGTTIISEQVELLLPDGKIQLEPAPECQRLNVQPDTNSKMKALHLASRFMNWYQSPFFPHAAVPAVPVYPEPPPLPGYLDALKTAAASTSAASTSASSAAGGGALARYTSASATIARPFRDAAAAPERPHVVRGRGHGRGGYNPPAGHSREERTSGPARVSHNRSGRHEPCE
jgi:hypothetical protein